MANVKQTANDEPICYGRMTGHASTDEHYDGLTNHARRRAAQLRKLGYKARCSSLGMQVTPVGLCKMTMVTIWHTYDNIPPMPTRLMEMKF